MSRRRDRRKAVERIERWKSPHLPRWATKVAFKLIEGRRA